MSVRANELIDGVVADQGIVPVAADNSFDVSQLDRALGRDGRPAAIIVERNRDPLGREHDGIDISAAVDQDIPNIGDQHIVAAPPMERVTAIVSTQIVRTVVSQQRVFEIRAQ